MEGSRRQAALLEHHVAGPLHADPNTTYEFWVQ